MQFKKLFLVLVVGAWGIDSCAMDVEESPITMNLGDLFENPTIEKVTNYLQNGGDVNVVYCNARWRHNNKTLLFCALENTDEELAEFLISSGADVNCAGLNKFPLFFALKAGCSVLILKLLLNKGARLNSFSEKTPAELALLGGNFENLWYLIQNGFVFEVEDNKETILEKVCESKNCPKYFMDYLFAENRFYSNNDLIYNDCLHKACKIGNFELAQYFVEQFNLDVNQVETQEEIGYTPLHFACSSGNDELVTYLLEQGADVNVFTKAGWPPLFFACKHNDQQIVLKIFSQLISYNADVNCEDIYGYTSARFAVEKGHFAVLLLLKENGANINSVVGGSRERGEDTFLKVCKKADLSIIEEFILSGEIKNINEVYEIKKIKGKDKSRTALQVACEEGRLDVAELLVRNGADIDVVNSKGRTALHFACEKGHSNVVKYLLGKDADANKVDSDNKSPLRYAVWSNNCESVREIILAGGMDDAEDKKPLLHVASEKHVEILKVLIESDKFGFYDYIQSLYNLVSGNKKDRLEKMKLLVENGADVNSVNKRGNGPLDNLLLNKNVFFDEIMYLVNNGAEFNIDRCVDYDKNTPFHIFCRGSNKSIEELLQIIEFLLKKGFGINAQNKNGETPLFIICYNNLSKISVENQYILIKFFVKNGADVNVIDKCGRGPLAKLFLNKNATYEEIKFLVDNNAVVNVDQCVGDMPFHVACSNLSNKSVEDCLRIMRFLLDQGFDINSQKRGCGTILNKICGEYRNIKPEDRLNIVKFLLENGADVNVSNEYLNTSLHNLCKNEYYNKDKRFEIMKLLVENDVNVNAINKRDETVFDNLLLNKNASFDEIAYLVEHGAEFNIDCRCTDYGYTPFHIACRSLSNKSVEKCLKIMKFLLVNGFDINATNNQGQTPLDMVLNNYCSIAETDRLIIVKFFQDHSDGMDIESSDDELNFDERGSWFDFTWKMIMENPFQ